METRKIKDLKVPKAHQEIYSPDNSEAMIALQESIKDFGLIDAITIDDNNQILSGERRLEACKAIGKTEVEVNVKSDVSEDQILPIILDANLKRKLTFKGILNLIPKLRELYPKRRGHRSDKDPNPDRRTTDEKIAAYLNISAKQLEKIEYIRDNDRADAYFVNGIDKGETTVNLVHKYLTDKEKAKEAQKKKQAKDRPANAAPVTVAKCEGKTPLISVSAFPSAIDEGISINNFVATESETDESVHVTNASSLTLPTIKDKSVKLFFYSPPYYKKREYPTNELGNEATPEEYIQDLMDYSQEYKRCIDPRGSLVVNIADSKKDGFFLGIPARLKLAMMKEGWMLVNDVIWAKSNPMPLALDRCLNSVYENCMHFVLSKDYYYYPTFIPLVTKAKIGTAPNHQNAKHANEDYLPTPCYSNDRKNMGDFWTPDKIDIALGSSPEAENTDSQSAVWMNDIIITSVAQPRADGIEIRHPAPMKQQLAELFIQQLTQKGDLVVDTYAGTGTTLVAAKKLGRLYHAYEIDPEYCAEIIRRLRLIK
jgi:site-specific DNA-methyltransferase (adenine-specific)